MKRRELERERRLHRHPPITCPYEFRFGTFSFRQTSSVSWIIRVFSHRSFLSFEKQFSTKGTFAKTRSSQFFYLLDWSMYLRLHVPMHTILLLLYLQVGNMFASGYVFLLTYSSLAPGPPLFYPMFFQNANTVCTPVSFLAWLLGLTCPFGFQLSFQFWTFKHGSYLPVWETFLFIFWYFLEIS